MVLAGPSATVVHVLTRSSPLQRPQARVRKAVRDVFVVIAALAMFGAQALSSLHFVLVPHHLCAEHGVLEDGTASAQAAHEDEPRDAPSTVASEPSGELDEHDACSVATRDEHNALPERPALGPLALVETDVARASAGVLVKPERAALLSRAPKTSPPVRA
jgi:hypothetical protein